MKRRTFIRSLATGSAAGLTLGGIPVNLLAANSRLKQLAASSPNDNILIFIQLHGGNDGLNTLIPVSQYTEYYNLRPNIAIREKGTRSYIEVDPSVDEPMRVGLHPDMGAFKEMYDQGKVVIVQNVGYPEMNLSHFRGRDVVFMGADESGQYDYRSGWMGRYLDNIYPGYPDAFPNETMLDPLGIELSGTLSLAFHRENGIPIGLNIGNPQQFYDLINSVGVEPPGGFPEGHAGEELRYIMEFEQKSNQYAERMKDVYLRGSEPTVEYRKNYPYASPARANNLASQLELVARLISGGIKTKIFLCRIGGFDTHGEQVIEGDSSEGLHASLLYNMSTAIQDFYTDLGNQGLDHKVLSITFTEFGRRAYSNESYGTDHGTATPVFVFGTRLNNGIYGENPGLKTEELSHGNLVFNIDYRRIYTSIIQDWFEGDDEALVKTGFNEWVDQKIDIVASTGTPSVTPGRIPGSLEIYPNPVTDLARARFILPRRGTAHLYVIDGSGRRVATFLHEAEFGPGEIALDLSGLKMGIYHLALVQEGRNFSARFIKL
jgi:uncharacterized protein (DUF1501 family)